MNGKIPRPNKSGINHSEYLVNKYSEYVNENGEF